MHKLSHKSIFFFAGCLTALLLNNPNTPEEDIVGFYCDS